MKVFKTHTTAHCNDKPSIWDFEDHLLFSRENESFPYVSGAVRGDAGLQHCAFSKGHAITWAGNLESAYSPHDPKQSELLHERFPRKESSHFWLPYGELDTFLQNGCLLPALFLMQIIVFAFTLNQYAYFLPM